MKRINIFIARLISKLFPHTRVVNFRTEDDMVLCNHKIINGGVYFNLLKEPMSKDMADDIVEMSNFQKKDLFEYKYKYPFIVLQFHKTESVDLFIESLKKLKEEMQAQELADFIKNGGNVEFVWDKEPPKIMDGAKVVKYSATLKLSENEEAQNKQEKDANNNTKEE